jgi:hypothetical protein
MPLFAIPIDALSDQLLARPIGEADYAINTDAGEHGRLPVGRIMRVARSSGRTAWFWTLTTRLPSLRRYVRGRLEGHGC